jgi:hypothetical protein
MNNEICDIEIHHHPLTLYDYVSIAIDEMSRDGFTAFSVAEKVLEYHFRNYVGFIPLSSTEHQKYHAKALYIPMDIVEGGWKSMQENVEEGDQLLAKIERLETVVLDTCGEKWHVSSKQYFLEGG